MPLPKPVVTSRSSSVPGRARREPDGEESTAVRRYGAALAIEAERAATDNARRGDAGSTGSTPQQHEEALAELALGMRAPLTSMMLTSVVLRQHTETDPGTAHLRRYVDSLQRSADQLDVALRALIQRAAPVPSTQPSSRPPASELRGSGLMPAQASARTPLPTGGSVRVASIRPTGLRASPLRVLVVDDDSETLASIRDALEHNGFEVLTAANGVSALAAVETSKPDVIVLDLCLPGMDGEQICRELRRKLGRGTPIVMVSASIRMEATCRTLGLEHYLRKPFDVNDLVSSISRACGTEVAACNGNGERVNAE